MSAYLKVSTVMTSQSNIEYFIGIMSGTSMDGVDVALVAFSDSTAPTLIQHLNYPMNIELKAELIQLGLGHPTHLQQIGELDHRLGLLFAEATKALLGKFQLTASQITAIGCHGQTVFHAPDGAYPFTMQLGDASLIAAKTGIMTIADFRRKDMAYGGQGAPLVPAFHQHVLEDAHQTRVIANIGGIANITVLKPHHSVAGYDTGPGNMLMDAWIHRHLQLNYDDDGQWARTGTVQSTLLSLLLNDEYFAMPAPKSTGRERFNLLWLDSLLDQHAHAYSPQDVQATLLEFTAQSLAMDIQQSAKQGTVFVCGGGARNPLLMERIAAHLPQWHITTTQAVGVDPDYLEAIAFAWLAYRTYHHQTGNLPEVTGATQATTLGGIYYP